SPVVPLDRCCARRRSPPRSPRFPYTTLFRSVLAVAALDAGEAVTPPAPVAIEPIEVAEQAKAVAPVPFTRPPGLTRKVAATPPRSEEHTSELQSRENLVCRLLLEKKKTSPTA